jgi:ATP synthase protein I
LLIECENCPLSTKNKYATPGKPQLKSVFIFELIVGVLLSLIVDIYSFEAAYSALLGVLIASFSNIAFDLSAYRYARAVSVQKMVKFIYQGELLKILITALLFATVFYWVKPINIVALFVFFALMLIAHGFIPLILKRFSR